MSNSKTYTAKDAFGEKEVVQIETTPEVREAFLKRFSSQEPVKKIETTAHSRKVFLWAMAGDR